MKEFKDKVAVITGAASGIGYGIAKRCIQEGVKVVLADINEEDLERAEFELRNIGGALISVITDVSEKDDMEQLGRKTLDTFGGVHLLFNNAGVGAGMSPWESTWNDWKWVINVNLLGVIHGVRVFTPIMLEQNTECRIINTSSIMGLMVGNPNSAPYSVTKHAIVALSESLRLALEQRESLVKVSVLCPGFIKTKIMNSDRNRPPELQDEPVEISPEKQAYLDFMNASVDSGMPPEQVADCVFDAIREDKFYIVTHPEWMEVVKLRFDSIMRLENPQSSTNIIMKIMGFT